MTMSLCLPAFGLDSTLRILEVMSSWLLVLDLETLSIPCRFLVLFCFVLFFSLVSGFDLFFLSRSNPFGEIFFQRPSWTLVIWETSILCAAICLLAIGSLKERGLLFGFRHTSVDGKKKKKKKKKKICVHWKSLCRRNDHGCAEHYKLWSSRPICSSSRTVRLVKTKKKPCDFPHPPLQGTTLCVLRQLQEVLALSPPKLS
jgi:hypothetical protein